jgi:eukaryotic-like serine/threonine-protein kinase
MPLSSGDKLGPYEILAPIGKGGMGEVYRAHDTRLRRDVAIKVSAAQFSERFEREAKAIAALNHPNICQIYDVGPNYLVMEFIEGESPKGPLPLDQALRIARQIADALEAAHDKGIVHRDLKPANIKIKPDGPEGSSVKVLDFGLAKIHTGPAASGENLPTLTMGMTQAGMILGTAAYMAPEQARGKENVDKRADIWAFGVVLYELLTGKRLFTGEDMREILAKVIRDEPDLSGAPAEVRPLLKRCLEKDPKKRLRDIGDWELLVGQVSDLPISQAGGPRHWVPWAVSAMLAVALAALAFEYFREAPPEARLIATTILPPEDASFNFGGDNNPPAISPDGKRIVFGVRSGGKSELWVRPLDSPVAQPLAGTENATFPFWSPDNKSIAFFADGKLKRIDVAGGPAQTIADAPLARGGAWSPDDIIVYSPAATSVLQRVAAAGGTSSPATTLAATNDRSHRFPWFLPDGRHFLFEDQTQQENNDVVLRIAALDSKEVKTVGPANSNAVYAQGHLLFLREHTLMAQPFDAQHLGTTGDAAPIGERVQTVLPAGAVGVFFVSRDGMLVYQTGSGGTAQLLTWFDRSGKPVGTLGDAGEFDSVEFSPDRKSVAVALLGSNVDVWMYEVARGVKTRFTFNPGAERDPVWSPDGRKIVFRSDQKGHFDLYRKSADLTGAEETLYADGADKIPASWSADGKFLLFDRIDPKTNNDIWVLPLTPDAAGAKPFPFLQTPFQEGQARFSPDGKWVAYVSNESQRTEIYVAPFPGPGGKRQISAAGGVYPRWRDDGKELFYVALDGTLMAAEVAGKGGGIEVGAVRSLGIPIVTGREGYQYDVSADGQRFLMAAAPEQKSSAPLTLVHNWTMLLKK